MKKKNQNRNLSFLIALVVIISAGAYFIFVQSSNDGNVENTVQDEGKSEEDGTKTLDNSYSSDSLSFSFNYLDDYEIIANNLGTGENSKLVLENKEKETKITFYGNYFGLSDFFADYLYYMQKSGDGFEVSKKEKGFIPEGDSEPMFSAIAVFGPLSGTSQISGLDMIVVWNADPNNPYEADFENILKTIKEI